jgi:hypothetical protein
MAGINIKKVLTESMVASESLATKQYYGVTVSGNRTVDLQDAVTDIPLGILQNDPASGEEAEVLVIGRTPIVAGETITAGQLIRIGADGAAYVFEVDTDTTAYCLGQCTQGGDAGEMIEAIVNGTTPFRGEE